MIDPKELKKSDIGRNVIYKPQHAKEDPKQWEYGHLSSFRADGAIFVRFKGPNGERCNPEDIYWEFGA